MTLFGIDIPMPIIIIFVLIIVWMSMQKRKIPNLKKEDKRLGYEISIAKKKQELKDLKGRGK